MDKKKSSTAVPAMNCPVCGYCVAGKCTADHAADISCEYYRSWSGLWQREMAALKRARRTTYLAAAVIAIVAVVVMILPTLLR